MPLRQLKSALDPARWGYFFKGVSRRLAQPRTCPACGSRNSEPADRKLSYTLLRCTDCEVLFRYPYETAEEMASFYQSDYEQAGLTTDLPSQDELDRLLATNFKGSDKDFSRLIETLAILNIAPPARVFDYGANWGYGVHQLRKAGYDAAGFEISKPRAAFAAKLDVELATSITDVAGPFDACYSGHVLEHVPNPRQSIQEQLDLTREGGFVLFHTPNGSAARRQHNFRDFHKHWGKVHPVLLTDRFLLKNFPDHPVFVAATEGLDALRGWDQQSQTVADTSGGELFAVIKKAKRA